MVPEVQSASSTLPSSRLPTILVVVSQMATHPVSQEPSFEAGSHLQTMFRSLFFTAMTRTIFFP